MHDFIRPERGCVADRCCSERGIAPGVWIRSSHQAEPKYTRMFQSREFPGDGFTEDGRLNTKWTSGKGRALSLAPDRYRCFIRKPSLDAKDAGPTRCHW